MLLVGDIGGTNTRLALFDISGDRATPTGNPQNFLCRKYNSLREILQEFMAANKPNIEGAVFGVAGPIIEGEVQVTNLTWRVSIVEIEETLNLAGRVHLLNDVEAVAYGIPHLAEADRAALNPGVTGHGNMVIIAPGTGLGEAILLYDRVDQRYHVCATEGGHADFAPRNVFEMGLLRYLQDKYGHVSYERVVSGMGINSIYDYVRENYAIAENPEVAARLERSHDRAADISQAAKNYESELCMTTMTTFSSILGAEAANMALKTLAYGGVYLAGGIPPANLNKLQDGSFMAAFVNKGRFAAQMAQIPVFVVTRKEPGLFGSACFAKFHAPGRA